MTAHSQFVSSSAVRAQRSHSDRLETSTLALQYCRHLTDGPRDRQGYCEVQTRDASGQVSPERRNERTVLSTHQLSDRAHAEEIGHAAWRKCAILGVACRIPPVI